MEGLNHEGIGDECEAEHCKVSLEQGSDRVDIHSKQLCVPLRIFLRVGKDSSFGMVVGVPVAVTGCPQLRLSSGLADAPPSTESGSDINI